MKKTMLNIIACKVGVAVLLFSGVQSLSAATIPELVHVGDAGNAADGNGYGAVSYEYSIGKYEVTNAQYVDFLNAVAKSDPYGLYHNSMGSGVGGIQRSGVSGAYVYTVRAGAGQNPVNYVSFTDAARYVNWMTNGMGSADTETGSYQISATHSDMIRLSPADGMAQQYFIASENEWYKAAFYDPTKEGGAGYWSYGTGGNVLPTAGVPSANPNEANYNSIVGAPVAVGSYSTSSYYGTFDQEGNIAELTDTIRSSGWVRRGGHYGSNSSAMGSGWRTWDVNGEAAGSIGFRIVMVPAPIPEPSTVALLCISMVGGIAFKRVKARMQGGAGR